MRARNTGRAASEGLVFGIFSGLVFGIAEIVASAAMGQNAAQPLRMFASVVMGRDALANAPLGTTAVAGVLVHLALSAIFGVIYGLVVSRLSDESQVRFGRQTVYGLLYGLVLWLVNFQIIAAAAYPWFLQTPQFLQAVMHAVFYGLPLGLMYTTSERRARQLRPLPRGV